MEIDAPQRVLTSRPVRRFPSRQEPIQRSHRCHADGLKGNRGARSLGLLLTRVARPQFGRPGQSNQHRKSSGKSLTKYFVRESMSATTTTTTNGNGAPKSPYIDRKSVVEGKSV